MRTISRPQARHCLCAADKGDTKKSWTFVRDRASHFFGLWVHADCGLPSKGYYEAAYEAGIL